MKIKLKEIKNIELLGGVLLNRVLEVEGDERSYKETKIVVPKSISKGSFELEKCDTKKVLEGIDEAKFIKKGDIVIKLAVNNYCSLIKEVKEPALVSSNIGIIRGIDDERVDINYLVAYLNSDICQKHIELLSGDVIRGTVSLKILENLEIPLPELSVQRKIARDFIYQCNVNETATKLVDSLDTLVNLEIEQVLEEDR